MVPRKDIKNKYDIFRSISKILVILLILDLSQTAQAQQWEQVVDEAGPGIRIMDERPVCWFSASYDSPAYEIQLEPDPGQVEVQSTYGYNNSGQINEVSLEIFKESQWLYTTAFTNIQYDSLGRIIEYYANITSSEYYVETHVYDATHDIHGRITGFKELRHYHASGNAYNIIVSDVKYDGFGNVKDGYPVTVNQSSLPIPPIPPIPPKNISDYVSDISIGQIWDYGDPTDNTDLVYEFYLEIYSFGDTAMNTNTNVDSVEFQTPAGNTFQIPKLPGQSSDGIWTSFQYEYFEYDPNFWVEDAIWEYRARLTDLADLHAYGDGEYTIILHHTDGSKSQTTAWFGNPDTQEPIPQPTQEPVLTFPFTLHRQTVESPVTFNWEPCTDPNTEYIFIDVDGLGTAWLGDKWGEFEKTETSWGPLYLPDGFWDVDLFFAPWEPWEQPWPDYNNDDGIWIDTLKLSKSRYRFTVEGSPWTMYEVWGGNTLIDRSEGSYENIVDLITNGYEKLGKSDEQTATFSGQYEYYLIATVGEFLLDSIQGSDKSHYSSFEFNDDIVNAYDEDNLLGPPDGRCAVVGGVNNAWDDYSGYFVFANPGNWEGLTVFTSDVNLNLSKSIVGTFYESGNISPNDTFTYGIYFDSNDFTQDITEITVVDILPDEVSFVSADGNELSGTYDPDKHTYTWLHPSLAPESVIEMQLTVQVNPDVAPGTTITNFVTINSNETPPSTTSVDVKVIPPLEVADVIITPDILRRNGTSQYITAVVKFPAGIQQSEIDPANIPQLYYQDRDTGDFILIGNGSRPVLSGTQITTLFDRAELMDAIYGYGEFTLAVVGQLKSSLTFYGYENIHISKFTGD